MSATAFNSGQFESLAVNGLFPSYLEWSAYLTCRRRSPVILTYSNQVDADASLKLGSSLNLPAFATLSPLTQTWHRDPII